MQYIFCLKYFSKNHTMVIFEINTLKSKKNTTECHHQILEPKARVFVDDMRWYFFTLKCIYQDIHRVVDKKNTEAPAEVFFLPPRDEYRIKLNELAKTTRGRDKTTSQRRVVLSLPRVVCQWVQFGSNITHKVWFLLMYFRITPRAGVYKMLLSKMFGPPGVYKLTF